MDFRLFGPFEVRDGGGWVDPGDRQQRFVLVILLLNANRVVSKDYLVECLWGGQQPKSDLITSYIARLRKIFQGSAEVAIEKTPTGYLLSTDENLIDVTRFRALTARARETRDPALYREALDLWRGPFLSDLDVDKVGGPSVVPPEDWRVDALVDLAELELAAGRHREIRDRLRQVWEEDHSQQRLAAPLMRALVAAGDHVRAVEVFHQTRDALDEFGMEVNRELREMMRLAQYGDRRSTLPLRPAGFVGRVDELAQVESAALGDRPAVVWISGAPGIGKTTLAVTTAHRLAEAFRDGQLFVDLAGFTPNVTPATTAAALERLLTDLGVPPESIPADTEGRADVYRRALADSRTLVVLDNAASEAQIEPLLGAACTLVTSREQGALTATDHVRLEPLSQDEAVELFRGLVPPERVHGRGGEIREVVAACGHVPLLIHLVAAQFRRRVKWPLSYLLELLRAVPPVHPDTTFPAQATIACTVSYNQLTEPQQAMFRVFALAPGPDLPAAGAAALLGVPAAAHLLEDLHRASLLEESAPGRFQMLDPLRDYVLAAHPPTDPDAAMTRLLDFYLVAAAHAAAIMFAFDRDRQPEVTATSTPAPDFTDATTAQSWLDDERRNLVAAVHYAATHGHPDHAWRLAVLLWRYFYVAGHLRDWTETLQVAGSVTDDTEGLAHVRLRLSGARWRSGALAEAQALAEQALPLWTSLGNERGEADTLVAIATYAYHRGDYPIAAEHFAAALDRYERLGDERGQGNALDLLGVVSELRGDLLTAEGQHLAAQELLRAVGNTVGLAHALDNLGCVRLRLGRLDAALDNHTEAHDLAVALGDLALEAYTLNNLGNTHRALGHLDEAISFQLKARRVADLVVDPNLRTQLYLDRGDTSRAAGDDRGALHAYRAALDLAAGTGERVQRAKANLRIAVVLHRTGQHAPGHWRDAMSEFEELGSPEATEIKAELATFTCACTH